MSLPLLITLLTILVLSILTISSSIKIRQAKKRISDLEQEQQRQQFADDLLKEIYDCLDTSVAIPRLVTRITKKIEAILPYTTLSTLTLDEDTLQLKITAREAVSHGYTAHVKEQMLASLATLEKHPIRDTHITEEISGHVTDTVATTYPASVLHLPLLLHQSVAAIITVTANKPNHFPKQDVAALHRLMRNTSHVISKLDGLLEEEKGRLNAMIRSLDDGLVMIDAENTLQVINPAAKHILSLQKENLTTMDVLSALPINFDFQSKLVAAIHHKQSSEVVNVPINNKQIRCRISPIFGTTGSMLGAIMLMHDETLTNSVPRMKEDFTNIIVHELRNPLTSIKASSELLVSRGDFTPEEQQRLTQVIYQQSQKLLTDVQQILDAAKLEAGVFTIHKKHDSLKDLITNVIERFQKEANDKMINVNVDVEFNLPTFAFDAKYLSQALTNLISNSMKFTSQGGTVHITVKQKHSTAVITITDTGAGIPKDKQNKLFHKFSQIEDASATVGKGLGLYVVRGIIEAHGGKIDIDSDRGRGTTITITLPMQESTSLSTHKSQTNDSQRMVN